MKTGLRILKKATLWALAAAFVVVVSAYAINSRDEKLSPQAVSLLKAPPNPFRPRDNLYLMLLGLDAPPGESVITAGQKKVQAYEAERRKGYEALYHAVLNPAPSGLAFEGKLPRGCRAAGTLWGAAVGQRAKLRRLLFVNRLLYRRYRALRRATGYYVSATPSGIGVTPFPSRRLRLLFLADFALRMQSGDAAQRSAALNEMADDLQVWKTVLEGYGSLSSKLTALIFLQRDFLMISHVIADPAVPLSAHRAAVSRLVAPFPMKYWKMGSAFVYEYRSLNNYMVMTHEWDQQIEAKSPWWAKVERAMLEPLFKKHATENLQAANTLRIISIIDGPPQTLEKSWSAYTEQAKRLERPRLSWVYNPVGKWVFGKLIPWSFPKRGYALDAYDTAALQRMVKLAYEIRAQRVPTADIPQFLKRHPQWATRPVDGSRVAFEPGKRQLSVKVLGYPSKIRGEITIPIWAAHSYKARRLHPR